MTVGVILVALACSLGLVVDSYKAMGPKGVCIIRDLRRTLRSQESVWRIGFNRHKPHLGQLHLGGLSRGIPRLQPQLCIL